MELDELKNTWKELNKRMEQSESLNKWIISDLLSTRQKSAKDKLMKFEVAFLIMSFAFAGLVIFPYMAGIYSTLMTAVCEFIFVFAGIWQIYKIWLLNQMEIDKCSTSDLIKKAIRFKVVTQLRTIVGLIALIPLFVIIFIFDKTMTSEMMWGACIGIVIGLAIGLMIFFKHIRNINSLLDSYKDINKFESEQ